MNEIVSTVVANGIWAVLFCGLLIFELRDSRRRETRYTSTICELSERLKTVDAVKSDTTDIRTDTDAIRSDTAEIKANTQKCDGVQTGGAACPAIA